VRWSVGIEAQGHRVLSREQIVELADAVAASDGIATGIGTSRFGAQLVVQAGDRDEAIEKATIQFTAAVARAGSRCAPSCGSRPSARLRTPAHDQAGIAGRVSLRGPAAARRLDSAAGTCCLRDPVQAGSGHQAGEVRGHICGPLRRSFCGALSFSAPASALLGAAGRTQVEGLHLHLRGAGRRPVPPRADNPRAHGDLPAAL
jgi:hypothetical protein